MQEIPHQLVGIARRGSDEDPEIRCGQQLRSEGAVAVVDGVEIGGIEKREPFRDAARGHDAQRRRLLVARAVRTREPRQDLRRIEPVRVRRIGHQHRLTRRRADHARIGHSLTQHRVHERGLAGTGRTTDHRQQRSIEIGEARQNIIVELVDDSAGISFHAAIAQTRAGDSVPNATHGIEHVKVRGVHLSHSGRQLDAVRITE